MNPNNVRALALLAYSNKAGQKWADAEKYAIQGLQALPRMQKGEMVSDADFEKQKTQLAALMNNVAGFSALQVKDYASAQKYLRAAVEADPNNLENVYPLALAYLTATPADDVNGLFFIARAASLAKDPAGKDQITKFGVSRYRKYHGSEQGWNEMLAMTANTPLPPPNFTISQYTPPTPKQQAHDLVTSKAPKDMSFAEWELILSAGDAQDAENLLTESGLDYLVEPDKYSGGIIFQSERVGAFFYVAPGDEGAAKDTLSRNGFQPYKTD